jgi:ATP-dependent DNA helicase RecQ
MVSRGSYCFESYFKEVKLSRDSSLINALNSFKVKTLSPTKKSDNSGDTRIAKVLSNLISRGCMTRMSINLERKFAELLSEKEIIKEQSGSISFDKDRLSNHSRYTDSFYIINPDANVNAYLNEYEQSWEKLDSSFEEDFLYRKLPSLLSPSNAKIAIQLIEPQRKITDLVDKKFAQKWMSRAFQQQQADFVLEYPELIDERKGLIIEVDGPHHEAEGQRILDEDRDRATYQNQWEATKRIKVSEWGRISILIKDIEAKLNHITFTPYRKNIESPLYAEKESRLMQFAALAPISIARIQKVFLETIIDSSISLEQDTLNIGVIEQDISCALWAIDDLLTQIEHLNVLSTIKIQLPKITLAVKVNPKYSIDKYNEIELHSNLTLAEFNQSDKFDLIIDHAILNKVFPETPAELENKTKNLRVVRSSFNTTTESAIHTDQSIIYKEFAKRIDNDKFEIDSTLTESLKFFLQSIFRKHDFREGQLPILCLALQSKTVIGLLPTGGGKSLTYQLASFLQPGLVLVIDPIKSLMHDQLEGLHDNLIDSCTYLNSSVQNEARELALNHIANGTKQIIFISPERLQIESFRRMLDSLSERQIHFSYAVIDEAHCVSEWGHDFRTSYLSLGENLRKYCKTATGKPIPTFALTATASFDVLADVQRELSPMTGDPIGDDSLIQLESVKRNELQFVIHKVSVEEDIKIKQKENQDRKLNDWDYMKMIGSKKHLALSQAINQIAEKIQSYNNAPTKILEQEDLSSFDRIHISNFQTTGFTTNVQNGGVIFCPHKSWYFGVTDRYKNPDRRLGVAENIPISSHLVGTFHGADSDDELTQSRIETDNITNQNSFKKNQINLLVATKAFGMGIDKPNIRYTFHLNYPSSIESFVQEAGRAGRDGKLAVCNIIFNDEPLFKKPNRENEDSAELVSLDQKLLYSFHNNSFKGQNKEKRSINELLNNIRFPSRRTLDTLKERVSDDLGLQLNFWTTRNSPNYLNIASAEDRLKYGAINLENGRCYFNFAEHPEEIGRPILNQVLTTLHDVKPAHLTLVEWCNSTQEASQGKGILKLHDELQFNEPFELVIGFITDQEYFIKNIAKILSDLTGIEFKKEDLYKLKNSGSGADFIESLFQNTPGLKNTLDAAEIIRIQDIYDRLRDKADTEKAIYRLLTLGIIEDYAVDFNQNTFTLWGRKLEDRDYLKNLSNYLLRYYSEKRVTQLMEEVENRQVPENKTLFKCLSFLIDFVYKEVEEKRFRSIGAMREACVIGEERGNLAFKEHIDLYFHSKYARADYEIDGEEASLLKLSDKGKIKSIGLVWDFIEIVKKDRGSQIDNLKHLRGACTRILNAANETAPLQLLKSYATILIEINRDAPSKDQITDAQKLFIDSMLSFRKDELSKNEDFILAIDLFKGYLLESLEANRLEEIIDDAIELLKLKVHSEWTQNFSQNFLNGYKSTNTSRVREATV